jgi:hypothetical protein
MASYAMLGFSMRYVHGLVCGLPESLSKLGDSSIGQLISAQVQLLQAAEHAGQLFTCQLVHRVLVVLKKGINF